MARSRFYSTLVLELNRIDAVKTAKRNEIVIESYTKEANPQAIIGGKNYILVNSNDYLGLRHHPALKQAEHKASEEYGTGPGAVRFISGTLKMHRELEQALAAFHSREDALIFSSAFAANLAVMFTLSQGLSKDSLINSNVLIVSDALNHRSIIDGVRLTGLPKEQRQVFTHRDPYSLRSILDAHKGTFSRAIVVTDGVFSMLGVYQRLAEIRKIVDEYNDAYEQGVLLVVDDAHGVGVAGQRGRGTEEVEGVKADILVGTLGKAFGTDGGYVVGDKVFIDYLRESAATYIYSNSLSPGTAAAALAAVELVQSPEGERLLAQSRSNALAFREFGAQAGLSFAAESNHPIQPVLIGDPSKARTTVERLFSLGYLATQISYPVVPPGKDEIRIQISALHTEEDLKNLATALARIIQEDSH